MSIDFEQARFAMIEQQIRPWEVLDPRVLNVYRQVRREDFVASRYRKMAFSDLSIPLEHDQQMMKPVVEGRMLQALDLQEMDSVLEVGTGSGFITACLATLARAVHSIDIYPDLIESARAVLHNAELNNVELEVADVFSWNSSLKFDAVCVTGAVHDNPEFFARWLKPGGRLFVISGESPVMQASRLRLDTDGLFETDLPYLIGGEPKPRFLL